MINLHQLGLLGRNSSQIFKKHSSTPGRKNQNSLAKGYQRPLQLRCQIIFGCHGDEFQDATGTQPSLARGWGNPQRSFFNPSTARTSIQDLARPSVHGNISTATFRLRSRESESLRRRPNHRQTTCDRWTFSSTLDITSRLNETR